MQRRAFLLASSIVTATGLLLAAAAPAAAQSRQETLVVLVENGPNSLDIHGVGTSFRSYVAAWNMYDRLITFGRKTLPDGTLSYDYSKIEPELAESFTAAPDGKSFTFKIRRDAKFHDGSPVTAHDVKWSYDRAVSVGGFPTFQMAAGSLTKPEQFTAVDDYTFRVDLPKPDKLALPDMAVVVPAIFNSKLAKKNATEKDPWAMEWMKTNSAAGGAYKLEKWAPGQETVLVRNDDWKSGPLPKIKRVIMREVPSAGNRRALMERGDADISVDMPQKDAAELLAGKDGKYKVVGVPIENSLKYIGMVTTMKPFDDARVRQAIAYATPFDQIYKTAIYGRGIPMSDGPAGAPKDASWPQPFPVSTDLEKAKKLLAEAGYPNGFETTISIDLGDATASEPEAVLLQQSLAQIGIKTTIEKIPGANFRSAMLQKNRPLHIASFGGWLNFPDYYFFWGYHGQNAVFNTMSYKNEKMDALIDASRYEADPAKYKEQVMGFIKMSIDEMPRVPLYQQILDVGMQKNIKGYTYWFHRQLDVRQIEKL
ncbi:ABC transporter substrate-binding protein [Ferrovibrio sp.]|uniref:ABC transporter substrate-binding protein n=1 Tax=Ferrovibrio sp. TaxID=1917215 RepID=UPI0025C50662|nr:ABC transporter substrate-binding protein [Ferrovibrio sp.]MBX3453814.1 ABC transporter substrate-binding protein [Ferrovibrio sp.]